MSKIMEKTLASLPKLLAQGFSSSSGSGPKMPSSQDPNPDVMNFMRAVHRARSKSHETSIVLAELADMEKKLQANLSSSIPLLRVSFTKAIFCSLLGYDVMFIAIHAIKLAQQGQGYDKKLGYLVASLLLHPGHSMTILMTGTLLSDLGSPNMGDNFVALTMAVTLADKETIPYLLPQVLKKLTHPHDLVKERALQCLKSFYQRAPSLLEPTVLSQFGVFLSSRDPGVLSAVVCMFLLMCERDPSYCVGYGPSFLHILHQINNRGFGSSYYHHMVPLPWLQINLLKVLAHLGAVDPPFSRSIAPTLQTLIERTKVTEPISLALLVESIHTATKISAPQDLLQLCSRCIAKLLSTDAKSDLRFQGLGLLIALARVKPGYTAEHQASVLDCLGDSDPALQHRTTELLHSMANRANVKAICNKLFDQIDNLTDSLFIASVFSMIADLIERFPHDLEWYIQAYFRIIQHKKVTNAAHFSNSVVSHMVSLCSNTPRSEQFVSENVIESLYQPLENISSSSPFAVSLAITLFGVVAPQLHAMLSSQRILDLMEKLLFPQTNSDKAIIIIHPLNCSSQSSISTGDQDVSQKLGSECIETLIKLVLSGSLCPQTVAAWLCEHREKQTVRNSTFCCNMQELQDLVNNPQYLKLHSAILNGSEEYTIDLSLSFLDPLVLQHFLNFCDVPKPLYLQMDKKCPVEDVIDLSREVLQSQASEGSTEASKNSMKPVKPRDKWTEEEEENREEIQSYLFMPNKDLDSEVDSESMMKRKAMAEELFAGLILDSSEQADVNAKKEIKSAKSFWDSEEEEDESTKDNNLIFGKFIGLKLNPFGVSKKDQASRSHSCWNDDESLAVAAPGFIEDKDYDGVEEYLSAQIEKVETPASAMSQNEQYQMFSSFPTSSSMDHLQQAGPPALTQSLEGSCGAHTLDSGLGSRELSGAGLSIYSEVTDGADLTSTVDTLTDSEPDE